MVCPDCHGTPGMLGDGKWRPYEAQTSHCCEFDLQYLHERNILHRDLKTQNIFLMKTNIIKVGDLGIARVLENKNDMASTLIGTPYYMSPELFSNKPYNHKVT